MLGIGRLDTTSSVILYRCTARSHAGDGPIGHWTSVHHALKTHRMALESTRGETRIRYRLDGQSLVMRQGNARERDARPMQGGGVPVVYYVYPAYLDYPNSQG